MTQMGKKIITEKISKMMLEDYNAGITITELSNKYGFKQSSISSYFNKRGISLSKSKKFSNEELENIINDYNGGMKPYELSQKYNRNSSSIIGKLRAVGIYRYSNYRYTKEDIDFLKKYYPLNDWVTITKRFPNVSKYSIHTKMHKLGIKAEKFFEDKIWTNDEINILKNNYGKISNDEIQLLLPTRTYSSITSKAEKLGLKIREYWTSTEEEILKEYYSNMTMDDICSLLPDRSRGSIIMKAQSLNLRNSCKYQAWESEFIINNWKFMSDKEMAIELGRDKTSIKGKRLSLGFLREKECSSYNDLSEYVRRNNLAWKKESMKDCKYKCVLSGKRFDDIHHIYGLNLILNETLEYLGIAVKNTMDDYSDKELKNILITFREKQFKYPLGVCLSKEIHMLFHNNYGYGHNTPEQWEDFVSNYKNSKYINNLKVA